MLLCVLKGGKVFLDQLIFKKSLSVPMKGALSTSIRHHVLVQYLSEVYVTWKWALVGKGTAIRSNLTSFCNFSLVINLFSTAVWYVYTIHRTSMIFSANREKTQF